MTRLERAIAVVAGVAAILTLVVQILQWIWPTPLPLPISAQTLLIVSAAGLVVLVIIILLYTLRSTQLNTKSRWGLAALFIGSIAYSTWIGTQMRIGLSSCADYGIEIVSPQDGADVSERFQISGIYATKPPDGLVRLYSTSTDRKYHWPQDIVQIDPLDKIWKGNSSLLGDPPLEIFVTVAIVGNSGRILYDYYWKNGINDNYWSPLEKITDDTEICDQVFVQRAK